MAKTLDPTLHRRKLSVELRRLRDSVGLTQRDASKRLEWSMSKLIRIEGGTVGIQVTDLRALLDLYEVTDPDLTEPLLDAARGTRGQPWWSRYREVVPHAFAQYLSFESASAALVTFQPILLPGLLQTDDYASAILSRDKPRDEVQLRVELRLERQERMFDREDPPGMSFLIDESALRRAVGGPVVMRKQLRTLAERAQHPGVSLRIMPLSTGVHPLLGTAFTALSITDEDDMIFVEQPGGPLLLRDDQASVVSYLEQFEESWELALSSDASAGLLAEAIEDFDRREDGQAANGT